MTEILAKYAKDRVTISTSGEAAARATDRSFDGLRPALEHLKSQDWAHMNIQVLVHLPDRDEHLTLAEIETAMAALSH